MENNSLTPRKIDKELLDQTYDSLSAKSEVFDSDQDPDYIPSDSENPKAKTFTKRLFEVKFTRQLDKTEHAGPSTAFISDEYLSTTDTDDDKPVSKKRKRKIVCKKTKRGNKRVPCITT